MDPSSLCSHGVTQSEAGLGNEGLNQGGSGLPFKCSGIDQVRPNLGSQLQKPFVETTDQFLMLSWQQRRQEEHQERLELLRQQERQELQQVLLQELPQLQQELRQLRLLQPAAAAAEAAGAGAAGCCTALTGSLPRFFNSSKLPKVGVDSQDQEELTMEASTIRSPPINPSPLYSQEVARSKSGLVNGGRSSFDDINGIESPKVRSKCKEKLWSNTSSRADNDFDYNDEMGSDEINLIRSQTPKVKSKCGKQRKSPVWKFYERITEKYGKERAQCIKCGKKYLIDSKTIGTSTLSRHVKNCSKNETRVVGQLEPIQEVNVIEARTPERPCVPQGQISSAVRSWTTLSSPASGVLGTTPAVTTKRRRLAAMRTESDKSIWSKTSAFRPTSHDSANKSAGTEADEGISSTPPAATEEQVQAPRDLQLSLATTNSGPQEESGSIHKQFASAEELRSIGEPKKALKITLNGILDSLSKGEINLESCKIAVGVVLHASAVDVKPLEAIFTEFFASSKEWQSIQDPASLYQNEVLGQVAKLRQDLKEVQELANEERSSRAAKFKQAKLYDEESNKHKEIILSSLKQLEVLDRAMLREHDEVRESEDEEKSSWIDRNRKQLLLDMNENRRHQENMKTEATERLRRIEELAASKISRLKTFVHEVEGILGVGLETAVPEVAAEKYAAHKREAMEAQLRDFSGKINDFFKE